MYGVNLQPSNHNVNLSVYLKTENGFHLLSVIPDMCLCEYMIINGDDGIMLEG